MSHAEERKEKDCLNCGTIVQGRFCQKCGQENIVTHETFGHMIKHFFYDITHFDSKFLPSLKYLVTKPGFLSKQYMIGKRTTYLNPVKMYVFTSAIFFLIFFSFYSSSLLKIDEKDVTPTSKGEIRRVEDFGYSSAKNNNDSNKVKEAFALIKPSFDSTLDAVEFKMGPSDSNNKYSTVREYDSIQRALPKDERDGWIKRISTRKNLDFRSRYEGDNVRLIKDVFSKFFHTFPYILFVSLPLYALFLKILYIRNKRYFFVDHGIFLIHLYIFTFIMMLVVIGIEEISKAVNVEDLEWFQVVVVLYGVWYAFKAMKNFYGQRFWKTLLKFILFNILCLISIFILFGLFFIITILRA